MGIRITSQEHKVALFDSVTGTAFGPIFDDEDEADAFLTFWGGIVGVLDLRELTGDELAQAVFDWRFATGRTERAAT